MAGQSYDGKVVVLTGANGAIGMAAAKLMAERGAQIFAVDMPGTDWAAFRDAVGHENKVATTEADVTREADVKAYVDAAVDRFGTIDVFFNNAGIEGKYQTIDELDIENLEKVLAVNVKGVAMGMKYVLPVMYKAGSGAIVNMSSVAGLGGSPGLLPYITSKHAVIGMTRTAALEAGPKGIRVNCVNPGPIESRMMDSINTGQGDKTSAHEATASSIAMGRYGTPEEVAGIMAFLGSDDAGYCNGGFYTVDGGLTAA
ncbi:SDR family NAD(P)-dependent oxidoreductase [Chachezhania antarctica]|mgnify:CR=1 FL=1|uniref:SDR family NAD(P)-dependent oxidoreductase n=1 Tax=Chachezhania antarctica TaxID=2340860 RepID=UPI000EAD583D|nr:SDR family oxidoreductase [Chachezhania antarctica]|tara:strand:+ start:2942 stop:3712 length:771 start_codon:yes stop_codon:yes gene_type:complete